MYTTETVCSLAEQGNSPSAYENRYLYKYYITAVARKNCVRVDQISSYIQEFSLEDSKERDINLSFLSRRSALCITYHSSN